MPEKDCEELKPIHKDTLWTKTGIGILIFICTSILSLATIGGYQIYKAVKFEIPASFNKMEGKLYNDSCNLERYKEEQTEKHKALNDRDDYQSGKSKEEILHLINIENKLKMPEWRELLKLLQNKNEKNELISNK